MLDYGEVDDPEIQGHLKLVERLSSLNVRLDAILHGREVPADAEGKLDLAVLCRVTGRFAASARFYREAIQLKPGAADDMNSRHRLHAAIAAAQAGTNQNRAKDDLPLTDAERARWRDQALDWLRAEKDSCAQILGLNVVVAKPVQVGPAGPMKTPEPVPAAPPRLALARKTLEILTHRRDLACLRDESNLKKLPEDERKAWQVFCAEVAALLKKVEGS